MKKHIFDITPTPKESVRKRRVAAYARVSCGKDAMLHSLAAQIDYYRDFIRNNPDWDFAGVYADEAKTGTKADREQFQRLLADSRAGAIDMVLTKSISRFARNTVTLLETVRELKALGVEVWFEEQNIYTFTADGEMALTLLASFAQAESLSCSDNCKWRIRKGFEVGRANSCTMLGYRLVDGVFTLVPEEAETVRRIFALYLSGLGTQKICKILNEEGVPTRLGCEWHPSAIRTILENEKYTGDLLLQKTFRLDHLSKKQMDNTGQLPQFYVEDDHEAIISREDFSAAQAELVRRRSVHTGERGAPSVFTGLIRCSGCGKNYRRKTTASGVAWCCSTYNTRGKRYCPTSKAIPEGTLKAACAQVLGLRSFEDEAFAAAVTAIDACPDNLLRFHFRDGHTEEYRWQDRSRRESWTAEMRETARQRALAGR